MSYKPEYLAPDGMKLPYKAMHSGLSISTYIDSETGQQTKAGLFFIVKLASVRKSRNRELFLQRKE
ncbi:hypothetical protein K040078D81_58660 [Blautia hominis]|uniref:Uncharacterized protein n=1 Tax=Blautia hominis TaxID=2025493 RepID=A0ABQ0BJY3_9FIRM